MVVLTAGLADGTLLRPYIGIGERLGWRERQGAGFPAALVSNDGAIRLTLHPPSPVGGPGLTVHGLISLYGWSSGLDALALPKQTTTPVQGFALFSDVSPSDCASIISAGREKHYRRKQTIFSEGDPVRQVVLLLSGFVKIKQLGLNGDEVILRVTGVGEIVGAFRLSVNYHHCSTAQAIQPSTAILWDSATFERLLERFPALRRNTFRALEERLQEMEQRFREVSTEKVGSRLSSELLRLSNRLGHTINGGPLEISLSRSELAQLTGTTLFTVSRLLCRWQKLGIVSIGREAVLVLDFAALTQLTQSE